MPAAAIGPAIGIGTSLFGGLFGGSKQKKATQQAVQGRQDAIGTMNGATAKANDLINDNAKNAGERVQQQAQTAGDDAVSGANANAQKLTDAAKAGSDLVTSTADKGAHGVDQYVKTGNDSSAMLDKYLSEGGKLNSNPTANDIMSNDPGYQFRLQQGQQAVQRAQAAMGGAGGGGAAKAMMRYNQGTASSEYGAAFDRYRATNNDLYDHLSGQAAQGQQAAEFQGNLTTGAAATGAGLTTGAASQNSQDLNQATQYKGNANINAATYTGNVGMQSAALQSGNTMNGAKYVGDMQAGVGDAKSEGTLGGAATTLGAVNGVAQNVPGLLKGLKVKGF